MSSPKHSPLASGHKLSFSLCHSQASRFAKVTGAQPKKTPTL